MNPPKFNYQDLPALEPKAEASCRGILGNFNLNISRYISTAVGEKEISLATTHDELVEIGNAIQTATAKHNKFLKELGLPPMPK
jgi:type I restriction-modification system DNA methylase subunit